MSCVASKLGRTEPMTGRSTHVRVLVAGPHLTAQSTFVKALASALGRSLQTRSHISSSPAAAGAARTSHVAELPSTTLLQEGSCASTHAADSKINKTNDYTSTSSRNSSSSNPLLHASDPFTAFQLAPGAWVTHVAAPGDTSGNTTHQVLYSLQAVPGWASTPDAAAYLETLTRLILEARHQDFKHRHDSCGSRGNPVSLTSSNTTAEHSYQVCLYLLPPSGPTAIDLVLLASLSRTLPLVPLVTPLASPGCDPVTQAAADVALEEVAGLLGDPGQLVTSLRSGDILLPLGGPLLLAPTTSVLAHGSKSSSGKEEEGGVTREGDVSSMAATSAALAAEAATAAAAGSFSSMSYSSRSSCSAGGAGSICSDAMDIWDLDMDLDMNLETGGDLEAARGSVGGALTSAPRASGDQHSNKTASRHGRSASSSSSRSSTSSLFQLPVSAAAGAALGSSSEEAFEWVALTAGPDSEDLTADSQPQPCSGNDSSNSSAKGQPSSSSWTEEPQQLLHGNNMTPVAASAVLSASVGGAGGVHGQMQADAVGCDLELQPVVELLTQGQANQLLRQLSAEAFESFCAAYQATDGNLEQLLTVTLQPFVPRLLAGPSLLQECVAQAQQQLQECEAQLQKCEKQREEEGQRVNRELEGQMRDAHRHHRQQLQQLLQAAATQHQAAMSAMRQQLVAEQQQAASKLAAVQEEADRQLTAVQQEADRQLAIQQAEAEQQLAQQEERCIVLQQQMRLQQQRATAMLQQALNTAAAEQQWALNNVQVTMTQQQAETEQRMEDLQRQVQILQRQLREERQAAARSAVQFDRSNAVHKQRYQRLWEQLLQERQQAGQQLQEAQQAAAEQHWRREMVQQQLQQEREQAAEQLCAARRDHERQLQQQVAAERQQAAADKLASGAEHQMEVTNLKEQLLRVQQAAAAAAARHNEEAAHLLQHKREMDQQLSRERTTVKLLQQQLQERQRNCKDAEQEAARAAQQVEQLRSSAMQQFAAFKRLQLTAARDKEGYEESLQQLRAELAEAQDKLGRQTKQLEGQIALHKWYRQAVC